MKKLLIFVSILTYSFAIISIEPKDIGEKKGISGEIGLSLEVNSGNTNTLSSSISAKVEYDNNRSLKYALFSYEYGESNSKKNRDRAFFHLRDLKRIDNLKVWEIYLQIQKDDFKDQKLRALIGTGPRIKFFNKDTKAYVGIGIFAIREDIKNLGKSDYFRGNFYLAFKRRFNENVKAAFTTYFQPKIDKFKDYETTSFLQFSIKLSKKLNLLIKSRYDFDSTPPLGVKKYDFSQKVGIVYSF